MIKKLNSFCLFFFLSFSLLMGQNVDNSLSNTSVKADSRKASFNLEEIKVRWKKQALENCTQTCTSGGGGGGLVVSNPTITSPTILPCFSAILHGEVSSEGELPAKERGIVYSTSSNPTIADLKVGVGSGPGTIKGSVSGLSKGTTYFFRSYAITSEGIIYSTQQTFIANSSCSGTNPN